MKQGSENSYVQHSQLILLTFDAPMFSDYETNELLPDIKYPVLITVLSQ